ncbi:unnamed protein product [Spirodela intermedia]|uniref:Uncharacterized protein n=1 Tax=Spirodela intermedia TaxID=51605 RepID=A0A7I8J9J2_SPIIN|nr:unnamed protein product [Spirodela intermedia]CAA6666435.1 unnamed protein product [Spirodela intermedia]
MVLLRRALFRERLPSAGEGGDADPCSVVARLVLFTPVIPRPLRGSFSSSLLHRRPPSYADLVDRVLKRLWNDAPRALLFFHALLCHPSYRPAASSFDYALDLAARLRDHHAVSRFLSLREKLHVMPTHRTFAILMERHAAAGKPDRAVRLFLSMHRHGCPQDLAAFNTLLDVLCKSRRVDKASRLFRALRGRFRPDVVTYNILADGWCKIKRAPRALEILNEMVSSGLEPTIATYNILLNGFFLGGQVKQAGGLRCRPDVVSYTIMVHGLGLAGQITRARKVFGEMTGQGCLPSVATYNALIQVICKKDTVGNALSVLEEMVGRGYTPNCITYNLVIRGLCHAGAGCDPSVQTYNILIRHRCEAGEIDEGLRLLRGMAAGEEGGGCLPNVDTYNVLIGAMFVRKRAEDMLTAGHLLVEMVERGYVPRRFTFNRVLNGLLLTGHQALAREILRAQSDRGGRLPREIRLR